MEISPEKPRPSFAERSARSAVLVFLLLAIVTLAFLFGFIVKDVTGDKAGAPIASAPAGTAATANGKDAIGASILSEIYDILKNNYVDKNALDPDAIKRAAINGVLTSLNDPHTTYLTPEDMKAGALDLNSTYQGIGASVSGRDGQVKIIAPFRESPAEVAGIKAGDAILEVDGDKTDGWTDQQAVQRIRGLKGTNVVLKVKHSDGKVETITVQRGEIQIESVFSEPNLEVIPGESGKKLVDRSGKVASDVAYLNISQFHEKTYDELKVKLKEIDGKGFKGLILDMRGNPGRALEFNDPGRRRVS
jgi:carboxyl-terminal processing protease